MDYDIKDIKLADKGFLRIEWAEQEMPVLRMIKKRFKKEKPLSGMRLAACLHVTTETANLMDTLKAGGAEIVLCASNPLSTQDDVAASLVAHYNIPVFAVKGEDNKKYYDHISAALNTRPMITMDDGADLVSTIHSDRKDLIKEVIGGTEETTTGVIRLKSMGEKGVLMFPVISVNDAETKHFFDNRYGTGQSTIDGVLRATNRLIAGSVFVVAGYGWCGRGIAMRAKGLGADVVVTEINPLKAIEAVMDGYEVTNLKQAAKEGDIFVTVTGDKNVISYETILRMKEGAILANSGHFNAEIDVATLAKKAKNSRQIRNYITEYVLSDGSKRFVLGEGRLINLVAGEGHPAEVMDLSFANQALACEFLLKNQGKLKNKVYTLPPKIDQNVARLKLKAMRVKFDRLTREQRTYLHSWQEGT